LAADPRLTLSDLLVSLHQEHTIVICGADVGCKPLQEALKALTPAPTRPVFWVWDHSTMPDELPLLCDSGLLQCVICTDLEKLWDRLVMYPDRCSLLHYDELLGVDLKRTLCCGTKDEKTWMDVGPGYGVVMNELLSHFKQLKKPMPRVVGIDASKQYTKMWTFLPETCRLWRSILSDLEDEGLNNGAHLVTDVFGPCSYRTNPLDALICLGLLLAPGGQAIVVMETWHFGTNPKALDNIANFFQSKLQQKVEFLLFATKADANKVKEWNLGIVVKDQRKAGEQEDTFEALRQSAEDKVGRWIASSEALWQNKFHKIVGGEFGKTKLITPALKWWAHSTPMFVKPAPDQDGTD
jgi:SAM-dependent methyltransferase